MKRIIFVLLISILSLHPLLPNFYEIDVSEKVVNFASYCKDGKITVFIISQHGCVPCYNAKEYLKKNYNMKEIDVYYCVLSKTQRDLDSRQFEERESNKIWSYIEGCSRLPRIYIFGQTRNPATIINGFDPERIDNTIKSLLESHNYYKNSLVDNKLSFSSNAEIENLKSESKKLKGENIELKNKITQLKKDSIELTKENEKLGNDIQKQADENKKIKEKIKEITANAEGYTWYRIGNENAEHIKFMKKKRDKKYLINKAEEAYEEAKKLGINCDDELNELKIQSAKFFRK